MSKGQFGYGVVPGCCVDPVCEYQMLSSYFYVSQVSRQTYIKTTPPRPFEEWIEKGHQRDPNLCSAYARLSNKRSLVRGTGGYNSNNEIAPIKFVDDQSAIFFHVFVLCFAASQFSSVQSHFEVWLWPRPWARGKRRGFSPGVATHHSQSARVPTDKSSPTRFFRFIRLHFILHKAG